jgi:hypothetical protein
LSTGWRLGKYFVQRHEDVVPAATASERHDGPEAWSILLNRHPGEGRDPAGASGRDGEIPAFAGMTR